MSVCHLDFETRSASDLKQSGADIYARHPSTDIQCMAYKFDDEPTQLIKRGEELPLRVFRHIVQEGKVIAHNATFELLIWNNVCVPKYNWPRLMPEQVECTMCMAYAMAIPASLEKAAAAMGINQQKDLKGQRTMMKLAVPKEILPWGEIVWYEPEQHPDLFETLYEYCRQDVNVEHELYKRLIHLPEREKEIWLLDQKINQRGIQIDVKAAKTAIEIVNAEQQRLDERMRQVTNNEVATCTATAQLTRWLKHRGLEIEGVAKNDITMALLDSSLPPDVREALLIRQEAAKSSTAKLVSMINRADESGRIRGIFQYHGAGTGRWAGRGIQPQNFPRSVLGQKEIEEVFEILGSVE